MKLKSIKKFLDCKESITRIEIIRYLLNQASGKMSEKISNRLWIEVDILLSKEIKQLGSMLSDDKSEYDTLSQVGGLVADEVAIKDIIWIDNDIISVGDIVSYIKQDVEEKLSD